ncbi:MAG: tryptophan-rich sensory protein [Bacilli bacterium]|nr:tryptophan-rich sensory protein [Bacilli bacterium]
MKINWKKLIIITVITFIVGSFFSWFTMNNMDAFKELNKPINVPGIIFPIVWGVLYLLMSISCYIVSESSDPARNKALIIYWVQLVINSIWSLIFFGFEMYLFAFIWLLILLISVIIMIVKFYKVDKKAAYLNIPYVIWIIFAGYLNLGIYLLNR